MQILDGLQDDPFERGQKKPVVAGSIDEMCTIVHTLTDTCFCRGQFQELELRVRHLSSNDVVANPSDYITKAEHARILDSRLAAKDYDSSGEMSRRVAAMEREAALRLAAREAELQTGAASRLREVLLLAFHCDQLHAAQSSQCSTVVGC